MKTRLILSLLCGVTAANGAISVTFSNTTNVLTNLTINPVPGTGVQNQRLVWGIIVDGAGDGFDTGTYLPTSLQTKLGPQILSTSTGATDDVLYLSAGVFSISGTADGSTGLARALSITNVALGSTLDANNVGVGDAFGIVWFNLDNVALGATTITATPNASVPNLVSGLRYGFLSGIGTGSTGMTIPTDGQGRDLTTNFNGADPNRPATFALIPEPSAALLGAIGALGLLRRRRN